MEKITDILFSEVETEAGEKLGRVFEIRSVGEPDHGIVTDSRELNFLLCGERGLLERLGFRETSLTEVPLLSVLEFCEGKIIVRDDSPRTGELDDHSALQ
jgi:hypothetical protein